MYKSLQTDLSTGMRLKYKRQKTIQHIMKIVKKSGDNFSTKNKNTESSFDNISVQYVMRNKSDRQCWKDKITMQFILDYVELSKITATN